MKARNRRGCYALLLLLLTLWACNVKRPDAVLPDALMEDVLYDFHLAKAVGEEFSLNDNSQKMLYMDYVYKKHGITEAQFDTSMVWFSRHPDALVKIYDKVNARLKSKRVEIDRLMALRGDKPKASQAGDSVDIWLDAGIYRLTGTPLDNKITFTFPADSNFNDRDTLKWTARFRYPDSHLAPLMALQVLYEKDTLHALLQARQAATETVWLAADTLGALKEVRGFIYYPEQESGQSLLVDRISLMRYHATDTLPPLQSVSPEAAADTVGGKAGSDADARQRDLMETTNTAPVKAGSDALQQRPAGTRPLKKRQ